VIIIILWIANPDNKNLLWINMIWWLLYYGLLILITEIYY